MKNLELKFRCGDLAAAERAAIKLGAVDRGILNQRDYFFEAPLARLKLRLIDGHEVAELIAYRRPDDEAATTSDYHIAPIANPEAMLKTLTHALGPPRELVKTRHLYIYKSTRIHVDKVDGVGGFVEFEALLSHITPEEAKEQLATIVRELGLKEAVAEAYVDLMG